MGINQESLDIILWVLDSYIGRNCRMIEFGNQWLREPKRSVAKKYFENIGVNHVSIDINGKDGALPIDLTKEINDILLMGTFDVLTNFGTSEHIKLQYPCWRNMHDFVKKGGFFIHAVPRIGYWERHGFYRYDLSFFEKLAEKCEYKIIRNNIRKVPKRDLIINISQKTENNKFMLIEDFKPLVHKI